MNTANRKSYRAPWLLFALLSLGALAAVSFTPNDQPFGYIAPPALSKHDLADGNALAYVPWFDYSNYSGDLLAATVSSLGSVNYSSPSWRASEVMTAAETASSGYWDTGRFIVTMHPGGYAVPFRKASLANAQVDTLKSDEDKRIKYLRGDRSEEGDKFPRVRGPLLGDIIHSNPVYVGPPRAGHATDGYPAFAMTHKNRPGRVYVGANDGMLHAFNAASGAETFAYIPSMVISRLKLLTASPYQHQYLVDGPLTTEDAYFGSAWHTVLVGGLGAGGRGIFALDVTSAAAISDETNGANGAGSRVLWEFTPAHAGGGNLGYTYSRISIVKLENGKWAAALGNGYESVSGKASLLLLDVADGSVIRELVVSDWDANGLSSPTLIDSNGNGKVDTAYAGDLNGSLWKFDLSASAAASWQVANTGKALFVTATATTDAQPITTAPEVGLHPYNGLMVYVGTGRLLSAGDGDDLSAQAVYGIRDYAHAPAELPLDPTNLVAQTLTQVVHDGTGLQVRTATSNTINWNAKDGWKVSLEVTGAPSYQSGERVIQDMTLRGGRLQLMSTNPTVTSGENWFLQLDAITGGAPDKTILDIDHSGAFTLDDNADGDSNGAVEDEPADRVVGQYKQFGLASRPIYGVVSEGGDAALVNQMTTVNPIHTDVPDGGDVTPGDEDYGLIGGHMDLDVSSRTYAIDDGTTDQHKHQWDDSYGTVVDFFDIAGGFRSVDDSSGAPGSNPSTPFLITVANANLSPGAVLEINGQTYPIIEYRAKMKRYLSGTLGTGETFPIYKLGALTAAESALGYVRLTSFKMSFASNAIVAGGLIGTNTGCVKGNDPSPHGEYRNGALTTQLLDASNLAGGFNYDETEQAWKISSGGSTKIHKLGHALPKNGVHAIGDGMMWESTLFWHWDGACYNADNETEYAADYEEEVGKPYEPMSDDDIIDQGAPDETPPGTDDGGDQPPREESASTPPEVSTILVGASDRVGRLFWRELIPDN